MYVHYPHVVDQIGQYIISMKLNPPHMLSKLLANYQVTHIFLLAALAEAVCMVPEHKATLNLLFTMEG